MGVELLRIDDRLVHGQVVEGWLKSMRLNHIIVASDTVVNDETQKALYLLAVPQGVELTCLGIADTALAWKKGMWKEARAMVLVSTPEEALALLEQGAPISSVNLGGLHFRQGRVQVLKGVSLDEADVRALKAIAAKDVLLEARPLPLDEPVEMASYLRRWQEEHEGLTDQPR